MNQDVDQMIAEHRVSPELVLDPEDRIQKWMVLSRGLWFDPELRQTIQRTQFHRIDEIHDVIKDGFPVPGRCVSTKGDSNEDCAEKPVPTRKSVVSFAGPTRFLLLSIHSRSCSRIDH